MPLPEPGTAQAGRSNGSSNGHHGGIHANGDAENAETFTAGAIPEAGGAAANAEDDRLEQDLAAVIPHVVEMSPAQPPSDQPEAEASVEDTERAQRLTSRETEMAQLLNEIFGKR
jgi:hypothetical protein